MSAENYDRDFPQLKKLGHKRTSDPAYYNCIAYVVGDTKRKWWPGEYHPEFSIDYWPAGVPHQDSLDAFFQAFATQQYVHDPQDTGQFEEGVEKIAIYALDSRVTHAAKQVSEGVWCSKLGEEEDIEHPLEGLEGPLYGKAVAFVKRTKQHRPGQ